MSVIYAHRVTYWGGVGHLPTGGVGLLTVLGKPPVCHLHLRVGCHVCDGAAPAGCVVGDECQNGGVGLGVSRSSSSSSEPMIVFAHPVG